MSESDDEKPDAAEGIAIHTFLVFVLCVTVVLQGGFFPQVYLLMGCLLTIAVIFYCRRIPDKRKIILFGGICLLYLGSAVLHGFSTSMLTSALRPYACFLYWLLVSQLKTNDKKAFLKAAAIFAIIIADISVLSFLGILPIKGSVVSHRISFPFQYANAAGIFFAVMALAMRSLDGKKLRNLIPLIETALFLTRSIGGIVSYGLGLLYTLLSQEKSQYKAKLYEYTVGLFFSMVFAVGIYTSVITYKLYIPAVIFFGVLHLLCRYFEQILRFLSIRRAQMILWLSMTGGCIAMMFTQRWNQGQQTLVERLIQIGDAVKAMLVSFPVGIGPGNWEYMRGRWQTAQYTAGYVHSGYLQAGVDAGILTLACIGVLLILYIWKRKGKNPYVSAAAIAILAHSALDYTLTFTSIVFLLLFFCRYDEEETVELKRRERVVIASVTCLLLFLLSYCFIGQIALKKAEQAALQGSYLDGAMVLERNAFFLHRSYESQYAHILYLHAGGETEKALSEIEKLSHPLLPNMLYLQAQIWGDAGEYGKAAKAVLEAIEYAPYEPELYVYAAQMLERMPQQAAKPLREQYEKLAQKANRRANWLAGFLKNQKRLGEYPRE